MFESFILLSKKNKAKEFLKAIKREVKESFSEQDFLDYMYLADYSPSHKDDGIDVVYAEVVCPMIRNDYVIIRKDDKPIGYASWAYVSKQVSEQVLVAKKRLIQKEDYGSGNEFWVMDVIAPWGNVRRAINAIKKSNQHIIGKHTPVNFRRWYGQINKQRFSKIYV